MWLLGYSTEQSTNRIDMFFIFIVKTRQCGSECVFFVFCFFSPPTPRGKFAVVKKCVEKATGKQYAAKCLRKRRKGQDCRMDILNEIAVLEMAEANPYVVALHEVYETSSEIILVLEW